MLFSYWLPEYLNAGKILTEWTKARSGDTSAWINRGLVAIAQQKADQAIESLQASSAHTRFRSGKFITIKCLLMAEK